MNPYAIVTGASGGIGSAIAIRLAKEGYDLLLIGGRQTESLSNTCALCRKENVSATGLTVDFSDPGKAEEILTLPGTKAGGAAREPDLLVNCAGISHIGLLQDMKAEEWFQILNVNLSSVFYM